MRALRFSLSQNNFTVGDIAGNVDKIKTGIDKAVGENSDVVIFPELAVTGYPPEDLIFKPQFIQSGLDGLREIERHTRGKNILVIAGFINRSDDNIYNSAAVIHNGSTADVYNKIYLPNYGVFDEKRYFSTGNSIPVYHYRGVKIGVNICEDIWYPVGPLHYQTLMGNAEAIVNISASPFHAGKQRYRELMFRTRAGDESIFLVNCNLVGGQDELVFDGASSAYDENGELVARLKSFEEDFQTFEADMDGVIRKRMKDIRRRQEKELMEDVPGGCDQIPFQVKEHHIASDRQGDKRHIVVMKPQVAPERGPVESVYQALVTGTRDYVNKNGFKDVVIAISGGVDSALVAAIAVDALGKDRVHGIYLPTNYSADMSGEDAAKLAGNLGIDLMDLSIQELFQRYREVLKPLFGDRPFNIAEENLQSRIRGNIVMALSNKFGWLVLTTGNKSEMSVGYATLYGDMAGGFAVIKDVLKTTVYDLVRYRNSIKQDIPERIITRAPSAELRPEQKDSDSLPEYSVLDAIIKAYVEDDHPFNEIVQEVGDESTVKKVIRLIDSSEYKRRQAPPGVKITQRAFGKDRRMPITNGYRV